MKIANAAVLCIFCHVIAVLANYKAVNGSVFDNIYRPEVPYVGIGRIKENIELFREENPVAKYFLNDTIIEDPTLEEFRIAADAGDVDAAYALAEGYLFGDYYPKNISGAIHYYEQVAQTTPNSTSNFMLGVIYGSGMFGQVEMDHSRAIMHYKIASELGDPGATMALAYRYYAGIGTTKNYALSLMYYRYLNENNLQAVSQDLKYGGPHFTNYKIRLMDQGGGLYGKGASLMQSTFPDYAAYEDGSRASVLLSDAKRYYDQGLYNLSFKKALECFEYAEEEDSVVSIPGESTFSVLGLCIAQLGHMYLRGEGCERNFTRAEMYLETALKFNTDADTLAKVEYDMALLTSLVAKENNTVVSAYYQKAAKHGSLEANLVLEPQWITKFEAQKRVAHSGTPLRKLQLAEFFEQKHDIHNAALLYKILVEQIEEDLCPMKWSLYYFTRNAGPRFDLALIGLAIAAEQGYEAAESSLGYLLLPIRSYFDELETYSMDAYRMALNYYDRSSSQGNLDSRMFIGDIHYKGVRITSTDEVIAPDFQAAADMYNKVLDQESSTQAFFNLGYMYELGVGFDQDFHMAKRLYDLAEAVESPGILHRGRSSILLALAKAKLWLKMHSVFPKIPDFGSWKPIFGRSNDL